MIADVLHAADGCGRGGLDGRRGAGVERDLWRSRGHCAAAAAALRMEPAPRTEVSVLSCMHAV